MFTLDIKLENTATNSLWKIYPALADGNSTVSHKINGQHQETSVYSADQVRNLIHNLLLSGYTLSLLHGEHHEH